MKFGYLIDHMLPTKSGLECCVNDFNQFQLKFCHETFSIAEIGTVGA